MPRTNNEHYYFTRIVNPESVGVSVETRDLGVNEGTVL
jgi:hypothetical protein